MSPALITAFDSDDNQAWNQNEYNVAMQDESIEAWHRLFSIVNADFSGIPKSEKKMIWSEIAIKGMDKDSNGKIDFGELQAYLSEL